MESSPDDIARLLKESEERVKKHFDESAQRVTKHVDESEKRIARHIGELETRAQMQLETAADNVKRAAEGFDGTLSSIDRRLDRLERSWMRNFKLHSDVLKNHAGRIEALEKQP